MKIKKIIRKVKNMNSALKADMACAFLAIFIIVAYQILTGEEKELFTKFLVSIEWLFVITITLVVMFNCYALIKKMLGIPSYSSRDSLKATDTIKDKEENVGKS